MGPSWTTRYHQTSTLVSSRASVLTWMDVSGCIRSFMRLLLQRMSSQDEEFNSVSVVSFLEEQKIKAKQRVSLTWIESKVIDEALPGDEGDLLDGRRGAAEAQLLQMKQRVDERTSSVQQLDRRHVLNYFKSL